MASPPEPRSGALREWARLLRGLRTWSAFVRYQPVLLLPALVVAIGADWSMGAFWATLARLEAELLVYANFALLLNDLADRELDRRVGSPRAVGEAPASWGWILLGATLLVAGAIALSGHRTAAERGLYLLLFALPVAYNLRPLRLKERGFAGLVVGAMHETVAPVAWILIGFHADGWSATSLSILAVLQGFASNLGHQREDRLRDLISGARTFGAGCAPDRLAALFERTVAWRNIALAVVPIVATGDLLVAAAVGAWVVVRWLAKPGHRALLDLDVSDIALLLALTAGLSHPSLLVLAAVIVLATPRHRTLLRRLRRSKVGTGFQPAARLRTDR